MRILLHNQQPITRVHQLQHGKPTLREGKVCRQSVTTAQRVEESLGMRACLKDIAIPRSLK